MVQQLWLLCLYCTTIVSGLPRGLLDVTQPPYSADNTGKHDVTSILQQAITDGYSKQLAVYFPVGKYLVSDTLTVLQSGWGAEQSDGGVNIVPCRFHSNTLIGSTEGACYHSNYTNLNHPPFLPSLHLLSDTPLLSCHKHVRQASNWTEADSVRQSCWHPRPQVSTTKTLLKM